MADDKLRALWQLLQDAKRTAAAPQQPQANQLPMGDGKPPKPEIIRLAKSGRLEELQAYVREHPEEVNTVHPYYGTALHKAVQTRAYEKVYFLLKSGANPNLWAKPLDDQRPRDFPPLFTVFAGQDLTLLRLLAEFGCDFNIRGPGDRHPLHHAIIIARDNDAGDPIAVIEEYFNLAEKAGVKIDIDAFSENVYNKTPLHLAAGSNFVATARLLLQKGANPNAVDLDGWTPLHVATSKEHPAVVRLLLANGASIDIRSTDRNYYLPSEMEIENVHCKAALMMGRTAIGFQKRVERGDI